RTSVSPSALRKVRKSDADGTASDLRKRRGARTYAERSDLGGASGAPSVVIRTCARIAGVRLATGTSTGSLADVGVGVHGAEQDAPQPVPIPEQPSTAIATGAAMNDRSTIRTITP